MMPKKARALSRKFWAGWLAVMVCLVVSWILLRAQNRSAAALYRDNAAALDTALPGFSPERLNELRADVGESKKRVVGLSRAFYPREMWLKKDYDSSILFVEGLNAANQELKRKAEEYGVSAVTLDFASKLPSGDEAMMLLAQLKSLQALVGAGMELGGRFVSVKPLAVDKNDGEEGIKVIRSSLEGIFPAAGVMDFLIKARDTEPRVSIEDLSMKMESDGVRVAMVTASIVSDHARDANSPAAAAQETSAQEIQRAVAVVRSINPFKREQKAQIEQPAEAAAEVPQAKRFFFRGKAVLRAADVAVIEDAVARETVFVRPGETYGRLKVKSLTGDEAVLENLDDGTLTTLKRGEGA